MRWKDAKVPLAEGHKINKAKPLFTKIEDDVINKQKEELQKNLKESEDENMSG